MFAHLPVPTCDPANGSVGVGVGEWAGEEAAGDDAGCGFATRQRRCGLCTLPRVRARSWPGRSAARVDGERARRPAARPIQVAKPRRDRRRPVLPKSASAARLSANANTERLLAVHTQSSPPVEYVCNSSRSVSVARACRALSGCHTTTARRGKKKKKEHLRRTRRTRSHQKHHDCMHEPANLRIDRIISCTWCA